MGDFVVYELYLKKAIYTMYMYTYIHYIQIYVHQLQRAKRKTVCQWCTAKQTIFFIHKLFSDNARYVLILSSVSNFVFNRGPRTRKLPASLVAQLVKNPPAVQGTWVWSLGQEDPPEEEMATHHSILAWKILRTEEPGSLQSMGSQESDTT